MEVGHERWTGQASGKELLSTIVVQVAGDGRKEIVFGTASSVTIYENTGDNAWREIWSEDWEPPIWSYFAESPPVLLGAAIVILFFTVLARRLPVLMTLLNSLAVLCACAYHYDVNLKIDASRVLALAVAFFALWLAFQHRRAIR